MCLDLSRVQASPKLAEMSHATRIGFMHDLRGKSGCFGRYISQCPEADEADCDVRLGGGRGTLVCTRGEICVTPRGGREALRSRDGGPSGVPEHSSPAPDSIWKSERGKRHGESRIGPTDHVEYEHNHFPRALYTSYTFLSQLPTEGIHETVCEKPCIGEKVTIHASNESNVSGAVVVLSCGGDRVEWAGTYGASAPFCCGA
ncbi:hypothetical protein EDB83DRAFT_1742658 [Lactarius deliciosus]|nr:hypothetical protein EDB83DRAFT_1742658 [Lactarius deliciosus]